MKKYMAPTVCLLMLSLILVAPFAEESSAADASTILVDFGNGRTEWITDVSDANASSALEKAVKSIGSTYSYTSIDGFIVGGTGATTIGVGPVVNVSWKYYTWSGTAWVDSTSTFDTSTPSVADMALGYYPTGTSPTETPGNRSSWTSIRGNSSSDGHQDTNWNPDKENIPGWNIHYGKGNYVGSSILIEGDRAYVMTGGTTSQQIPSYVPKLYCYDRTSGEKLWEYGFEIGVGYETATGIIIGGHIYVPVTSGFIYKIPLDGPNSDGTNVSKAKFSSVRETVKYGMSPGLYDLDSRPTFSEIGTYTVYFKVTRPNYADYEGQQTVIIQNKRITEDMVSQPGSAKYTGSQITPEMSVVWKETLTEGTDYIVEYGTNLDIGEGTVKITGIGRYSDSVIKKFNITSDTATDSTPPKPVSLSYSSINRLEGDDLVSEGTQGEYDGFQHTFRLTLNDRFFFGNRFGTGPSTLIYDSGAIYFGTAAGYVFCIDLDMNVLWKTAIDGCVYFNAPSIYDDNLFIGALSGSLYVLDKKNGNIVCNEVVYRENGRGLASNLVKVGNRLFFSYSDGKGMDTKVGGLAVYEFDGTSLKSVIKETKFGLSPSYLIRSDTPEFRGAYAFTSEGLVKIYQDGSADLINSRITDAKSAAVLLNEKYIIVSEYNVGSYMYILNLDGNALGRYKQPESVQEYAMSPPVIIGDWIYSGTDGGVYSFSGEFLPIPPDAQNTDQLWIILIVLIILIFFAGLIIYLRFVKNVPPIPYLRGKLSEILGTRAYGGSKIRRNKIRLLLVIILGLLASAAMFLICLSYGPSGNYSIGETFKILSSAIGKRSGTLTGDEIIIFESRLPRAMAAFAVGVGLSIAGSVYQAIIRNPLVDPYVMGVSAGAGTAAVASISAGFTFFGLFSNIAYAQPLVAMVGGLLAFFATMIIAEKSGGSSTNYVLGGVIVGLAFSAIQTLLIYGAGTKIQSAITWLFGSFTSVDWTNVWMIFIPAIALSIVPMIWAKEFNLVLLGEDQAQEMGLNVKLFNRSMLILASILTSVCVSFVGIIGFVGLIVPHLCRMILGGDHRLVMPASLVLGGLLMMIADFLAKTLVIPTELPVGAITTIIGAPLFVYLIIRKGRMYDG